MKQVVLYGGTFAPPHNGHLHAVRQISKLCSPDLILVMPSFIPPHKAVAEDDRPEVRYEMTRLAFCREAGFGESLIVSDLELQMGGKSYTVHTLEHLAADDTQLTLLCGTDMFLTLDRWYRAPRIFELAHIALMRRENDETLNDRIFSQKEKYERDYGADVQILPARAWELSSTDVRQKIANGQPIKDDVPPLVADYIEAHGLYRRL